MRVLLVEVSERLRSQLEIALRRAGYAVDASGDGSDGLWRAESGAYDVIVLDLMLPKMDGLTMLARLRATESKSRVLVLTAKDSVADRVKGLQSGADDYLVKPFALEELVARLEALLRRPGQQLGSSLQIANLGFDLRSRQASIDDQPQVLSSRETAVLELLMRSKGRVVSKKQVEDHIFGLSGEVASNAVEVYVHRLRKQLFDKGAKVQIHTIRGVGYLIAEEKRDPV